MALFSKRTVTMVLLSIALITIILRYPILSHERYQADSYFIHLVSQSIVTDGFAEWTFHPLSYLGYYPMSYPSGVPFLLSEFSILTGLSVEACILLMDFFLGILFSLTVFCLGREFIHRNEFVVLAAFLAAMGPRFVDTSYWVGSARAPLVVMFVLAVFACLRASAHGQYRLLIPAALFFFVCFAVHHMAVLLIVFGFGYLLSVFCIHYLTPRFSSRHIPRWIVSSVYLGTGGSVTVVAAFVLLESFPAAISASFGNSYLDGIVPDFASLFVYMAAAYTNQIGIVLPIAIAGIPLQISKSRIDPRTMLLLFLLIVFIPLLGMPLYVSMLLLPFVCLLGSMFFSVALRSRKRRKVVLCLMAVVILSSLLLPAWSVERWNSERTISGDLVAVEDQVVGDAIYLRYISKGFYVVSNQDVMAAQLEARSEAHFIGSGIRSVLNGDVTSENMKENVTWLQAEFPEDIYVWYDYLGADVSYYVLGLMTQGVDFIAPPTPRNVGAFDYFSSHSRLVVVLDNHWLSQYVTQYGVLPGTFATQVCTAEWRSGTTQIELSSYIVYQSERSSMYLVGLPS